MKITYKAPVGVIISGEEGILYGKPVLGCALDIYVKSSTKKDANFVRGRYIDVISEIVKKGVKKGTTLKKVPEVYIELPVAIPEDFEGVIAAEIVVTAAHIFEHVRGVPPTQDETNNLAFKAHKKIYPRASGLYTSLATLGGMIYFRKEFEFLKGIYKLPYKIPENIAKELHLDLSKKEDVYNMGSEKAELFLSEQEKRTKRAVVAIIKEDAELFFAQIGNRENKEYPFSQSFDGIVKNE